MVNAHATMWSEILKAGELTSRHGPQRIKENMISSEKCDPPPLYDLRKDHKQHEDAVSSTKKWVLNFYSDEK